jgi:hypothetical protein
MSLYLTPSLIVMLPVIVLWYSMAQTSSVVSAVERQYFGQLHTHTS